jgi:two-component system, NtrC family, response regulator AtoC
MSKIHIMVVDDDKLQRWSLKEKLLAKNEYDVSLCESAEQALKELKPEEIDLVLLDFGLPGMNGLEALKEIHRIDSELPVMMITANDETSTVVECMRAGAADYICKPFDFDKLEIALRRTSDALKLRREVRRLRNEQGAQHLASIVGTSEKIQTLKREITQVALSDASTVLLQGENGTGKDLVAKTIHRCSRRHDMPFHGVNCAAIPASLIESELFGHERGAFTDAKNSRKGIFELAKGGTVLLDEIGEMPLAMQACLLRVLEERTFKRLGGSQDIQIDIRLIASSNRDLDQAVAEGRFRQDLLYRLKVIPLIIPPLRERRGDLPFLVEYFLNQYNVEFHRNVRGVTEETLKLILAYSWPGNIRELRNVIERALILGGDDPITPDRLPQELHNRQTASPKEISGLFNLPPSGISLQEVERAFIQQALIQASQNQTSAARLLGLTRDAFRRRLKKFDLLVETERNRTESAISNTQADLPLRRFP